MPDRNEYNPDRHASCDDFDMYETERPGGTLITTVSRDGSIAMQYIPDPAQWAAALTQAIGDSHTDRRLDEILAIVKGERASVATLVTQGEHVMADLSALTQEVADTVAGQESALVAIDGLRAEIVAAGTDPVKLAELTAQLAAERVKLAAAIVAPPAA